MEAFLKDCFKWVLPALVIFGFCALVYEVTPYDYSNPASYEAASTMFAIGVGVLFIASISVLGKHLYAFACGINTATKPKRANKRVQELKALLDSGVITEDQFETKKKELQEWVLK